MKKTALLGAPGSIKDTTPEGGPMSIEQDTSEPYDGLVPEKSVLEDQEIMGYEGGIISPVECNDYSWVDDQDTKKKAQITVYNGANSPLAVFLCGVAESYQDKVIGLQSYKSLGEDAGLLFKYRRPEDVLYHMGSVSFPIDILFVNEDNVIRRIYRNIEPGSLATFGCSDIKYVLEIYGGLTSRLGIDVGDMIEIGRRSHLIKDINKTSSEAGFSKSAILTHFDFQKNGAYKWNNFPVVNISPTLSKKASRKSLGLTSDLINLAPQPIESVTAFYMDGLFAQAAQVKNYTRSIDVDDSWQGFMTTDINGLSVFVTKSLSVDARKEHSIGRLVRGSFAEFLHIDGDMPYNNEVGKLLSSIKTAYDSKEKIIFCTSASAPRNLVDMLKHKMTYQHGELIDLDTVEILSLSSDMDAINILTCIKDKYPNAKITIKADSSLLRNAGIPVPDDVKRKGKEAIKALQRAQTIAEESLEKMLKNKIEYEKHQGNDEVISNSKGQFHQSVKRNTALIKSYLIKVRDSIRILNDIRDITTTLEIIDSLVSSSKASSDAAEKVFAMIDKIKSPDFFIEFSGLTDGYESAVEDLVSSLERAKEYINSNILGMIVLSE